MTANAPATFDSRVASLVRRWQLNGPYPELRWMIEPWSPGSGYELGWVCLTVVKDTTPGLRRFMRCCFCETLPDELILMVLEHKAVSNGLIPQPGSASECGKVNEGVGHDETT